MAAPSIFQLLAAGQGASFDPTSISGCKLWLDASDGATITIGTGVSQWNDKSGNGYHFTQSTGTKQPAWGSRTQNSLNVVDFDGSDDYLARSSTPADTQPTTYLVVIVADAVQAQFVWDGDEGTDRQAFGMILDSSKWGTFAGSGITSTDGSTGAHQWSMIFDTGGSGQLWKDGASAGTGSSGASAISGLTLGARYTTTEALYNGAIAELLIYDSALSTGNRQAVEAYLKAKWGTP